LEEITSTGQELVEGRHYAADRIAARMEEIVQLWEQLVESTESKGTKLLEASQQQHFNRTVEDIEIWLSEIEAQLGSEDYGKDLMSVQNLLKKQQLLETDVMSHQDRMDGVRIACDQFVERGHFDAENIKGEHQIYQRIKYLYMKESYQLSKNRRISKVSIVSFFLCLPRLN
jgi:spectrin alpha